jgi:hypothetical protein
MEASVMRTDMSKVVVERALVGERQPNRRRERASARAHCRAVARDPEGDLIPLPGRGPLYSGTSKYLTDNLSPLLRFLHSRVGRPWDDVYAEIRESLRMDSTIQRHIHEHLADFVSVHVCSTADGTIIRSSRSRVSHRNALEPGDLYVDPETSCLRRLPLRKCAPQQWGADRRLEREALAAQARSPRAAICPALALLVAHLNDVTAQTMRATNEGRLLREFPDRSGGQGGQWQPAHPAHARRDWAAISRSEMRRDALRALLRRYQAALALVRDPYVQQLGQLAVRAAVTPR